MPGYSYQPVDSATITSDIGPCNTPVDLKVVAGSERGVTFTVNELSRFVSQTNVLFQQPDTVIATLRSAFACGTATDASGAKVTLREKNVGRYGNETFALLASGDSAGPQIDTIIVVIRKGNLGSLILMGGAHGVSDEDLFAVLRKVADKLPN